MEEPIENNKALVIVTLFNVGWTFMVVQIIALLFLLNFSVLFPRTLPEAQVFVLDSADYIDEIYYYGSGPDEIDWEYLEKQWVVTDVITS